MAKTRELCLWCGIEISDADEVFIERQKDADGYEGWNGSFCGDEHASLWVAKPFPNPREFSDAEGLADTLFMVGCLSVLILGVGFFGIGAVVACGWIINTLF